MGIQRYIIDKKINKALGDAKKLRDRRAISKIDTIAVFVDEYIAFNDKEFTKLQELMGLDHTHFSIITYKEKKSNFNEFRGTVILSNDIDWKGRIKSDRAQDLLTKNFDLLIDYTQANQQKKQLIVAMCKANFKVGFSDKKDELYDFMITVNPTKVSLFNEELVRYLKILKLI